MPTLDGRVLSLYNDLAHFPPDTGTGRSVVGIYNTLLVLAQRERQEDPVLSTMSEISGDAHAAMLRVLAGQILTALAR